MKTAIILFLSLLSLQASANVLIGQWEYDPEKIISELKSKPNVPEKILKCFELKMCGHDVTFIYTPKSWMQRNHMSNGQIIESEYIDYRVIEETSKKITFSVLIDGVETEMTFNIINNDSLSFSAELEGFKWIEYLRRKH